MATEYPPLNKIYVFGYSANDRDFPILSATADPRVAGYQVPKDLSACPDKRYPNHVFTGAQPISGDQRVRHVWEILPSPWVPFTRYDDDLGPVQGRRRSVKNEGQIADLTADKRTTYEAREGSAIVYTELEETWSIKTDEDGNSLFPVRDRDFYDPSRGPVQERRQLFVPTGEEEASLENVNGVITQTSYEPYNEFLSVKIVQTYKVDGPQLVGNATDNEGQLVTITTQRKAADGYVPPNPTATRTVEVSREDAESLVERIVDTPQVFEGKTLSLEKPDVTPEKFRAAVPASSVETSITGTVTDPIALAGNEISKSEQQVTEFVKRIRAVTRDPAAEGTLTGQAYTPELGGGTATVTEKYGANPQINPDYGTVAAEKEALGDGKFVTREVVLADPPELTGQIYDESLDIVFPFVQKFVDPNAITIGEARTEITPRDVHHSLKRVVDIEQFRNEVLQQHWKLSAFSNITFPDFLYAVRAVYSRSRSSGNSSSQNVTSVLGLSAMSTSSSSSSSSSTSGDIVYFVRNGYSGPVPSTRHIFFLDKDNATNSSILAAINAQYTTPNNNVINWPTIFPEPVTICVFGSSSSRSESSSGVWRSGPTNVLPTGKSISTSSGSSVNQSIIPPTLHEEITIQNGGVNDIDTSPVPETGATVVPAPDADLDELFTSVQPSLIPPTSPSKFPSGNYLVNTETEAYRHGLVRVSCVVVHVAPEYVAVPATQ